MNNWGPDQYIGAALAVGCFLWWVAAVIKKGNNA